MEKYIGTILEMLELSLLASVLATNIVNGVKNALGISNTIVVRLIVAMIDCFVTYWMYFEVYHWANIFTFIMCCLCVYGGAEMIYVMMGGISEAKKKVEEVYPIIEFNDTEEESVG